MLNVSALGKTVGEAQARAYEAVDRIRWPDGFCRRDIGWRGAVEAARPGTRSDCMPDLADLFPGFASHWIDTAAGQIFARAGGRGRRCCCCTAMPQTNVMWHRVAPALARALQSGDPGPARLRLVRRAAIRRRSRALQQARDGERHDRGDGEARPRALPSRRARPRRPRRLSARARSSRAAEKLATLDIVPT